MKAGLYGFGIGLVLLAAGLLGSETPLGRGRITAPIPYYVGPTESKSLRSNPTAIRPDTSTLINPFLVPRPAVLPDISQNGNNAGYALWRYFRTSVGLDDFVSSPSLEASASAHASYIFNNDSYSVDGHFERVGLPGFTGISPCDRELAAGFTGSCLGEVGDADPFVFLDIIELIDAPYHRIGMLANYFDQAGMGGAGRPSFFIDFGGYKASDQTSTTLIVYPFPGQNDAPRGWNLFESPSPLPDVTSGVTVGYPILIEAKVAGNLQVSDFSLTSQDGRRIVGRPVAEWGNTRAPLGQSFIWIPLAPLAASTSFHAEALGALDGRPFVIEWTFTTQPKQNFLVVPSSTTLARNSQVSLNVKSPNPFRPIFSFRGPTGLTVDVPEPNKLVVGRRSLPCPGCSVVVSVQDTSRLDLPVDIVINIPD